MYVQSYKDKIKLGQYLLDLIYSNIFGPYLLSYLKAKYYITFLDNYKKTSEIVLFSIKDRILSAFDLF